MTRKDLKGELERAIESSYMHQNRGTCTCVYFILLPEHKVDAKLVDRSVKVGLLSHTPEKIIDNLKAALPAVVKNIKDGWDNIQSLQIKTNSSVSLPIWTCDLGDAKGGRWDGMVKSEDPLVEGELEGGSDSDKAGMNLEEHVPASKGKGKKRPLNEDVEKPVTTKDVKRKQHAEEGVTKKAKVVKGGPTKTAAKPDGGSDPAETSTGSEPAMAGRVKDLKRPLNGDIEKPVTPKDVKQKRGAEERVTKKAKVVKGGPTKIAAEPDGTSDPVETNMGSEEHLPAVAGKTKSSKRTLNEDTQKPITPKEVKQKRSAEGGVKKKAKIVNGDPTKSAKGSLISKKPGRP
jgi:ribosome biogenesis protein UTP30